MNIFYPGFPAVGLGQSTASRETDIPPDQGIERVAFHEAGHAVAAHLLKRGPGVTTIEPTKTYGGLHCHGRGHLPAQSGIGRPLPLIPAMTRRYVETTAVIALAGPKTEHLRWPETGYLAPTPDEKYAAELVDVLMNPSTAAPTRAEAAYARRLRGA